MKSADIAKLLLRLTVGGFMLLHGIAKLRHGIGSMGELLSNKGLPSVISYGVYIGEVVAPVFVLIGLFARPAAAIVAFNMMMAVWLAHMGDLFRLRPTGGYALELQGFYLIGAIVIALIGAGRYSVSRGAGRWD